MRKPSPTSAPTPGSRRPPAHRPHRRRCGPTRSPAPGPHTTGPRRRGRAPEAGAPEVPGKTEAGQGALGQIVPGPIRAIRGVLPLGRLRGPAGAPVGTSAPGPRSRGEDPRGVCPIGIARVRGRAVEDCGISPVRPPARRCGKRGGACASGAFQHVTAARRRTGRRNCDGPADAPVPLAPETGCRCRDGPDCRTRKGFCERPGPSDLPVLSSPGPVTSRGRVNGGSDERTDRGTVVPAREPGRSDGPAGCRCRGTGRSPPPPWPGWSCSDSASAARTAFRRRHARTWCPNEELVFGGWDVSADDLAKAAHLHRVMEPAQIEAAAPRLQHLPPWPAVADQAYCRAVTGANVVPFDSPRERTERIREDLRRFKGGQGLDEVVVVNLASTERLPDPASPALASPEAFEAALDTGEEAITPAMLYAYAALREGMPYVNFTPSCGADVPALIRLAEQEGVPVAGKDGKTGQTVVKTVLAPALRSRALRVEGWYSTNLLGNRDGRALEDPDSLAEPAVDQSCRFRREPHLL
ncbi:inositol-3-phosphate synthase [Streptomyces sp. NPDC052701]|uniref:inositol-3-phosphate synthase n=1 Tax=Streptomyces sp. NPDC052701 TaxID=3155533 RepID=UPI003415FC5B